MSREMRAKQFAPFDALKGLQMALRMKEYEHDRVAKGEISEDKAIELSNILMSLKKGESGEIIYFEDGYYKTISGSIKVLIDENSLAVNETKISLDSIFDIKIK